jgi:hypothetical protein
MVPLVPQFRWGLRGASSDGSASSAVPQFRWGLRGASSDGSASSAVPQFRWGLRGLVLMVPLVPQFRSSAGA